MPITFHPKLGQILVCDFSTGFKKPEMVKRNRPVVVVSRPNAHRNGLVTVVALSSVAPRPILPHHHKLPRGVMPNIAAFQRTETWVKGDMIYTLSYQRLSLIRLSSLRSPKSKPRYYKKKLPEDQMRAVNKCILSGLGLGRLARFL